MHSSTATRAARPILRPLKRAAAGAFILAAFLCDSARAAEPKLEFNRDIRPILSENCFQCHGTDPAHREGKLRLDDRENATRDRDGYADIVPGKPDESEMILRLLSTDDDERMPPPKANKHVTPGQIALLKRWIAEGATYQKHWAFIPPAVSSAGSGHGTAPVDRFILARLGREKLAPAPAVSPEAWLRRAGFDLVGLPPTPGELDAFAADTVLRGERAYAAAADRLLASPHFGERLAIDWLDVARYADTHGFSNDSARSMWRWRDWVIDAFNANLPYDRFITEQLAGDLLPSPTIEQRVATGFGRNHVINSEAGIIAEEYRVEYVSDRVRTVSTAWLGLSMECAKCHDHKFDPVSQRDYFRLFAFFNNLPDHGEDGRSANAFPTMPAPTRDQQATLAAQERGLAALDAELRAAHAAWFWDVAARVRAEGLSAQARAAQNADAAAQGVALLDQATSPANPGASNPAAPSIPAAKLDFAGKQGVSFALWLRPAADNPRDVPLLSSLDYRGSPIDTAYGRGRELRLIDGELEMRLSVRYPIYSIIVRTEGAAIRPGEWRHVAVSYAGGKSADAFKTADAVRLFVDGREAAVRVLYDGLHSEPEVQLTNSTSGDFLVGADNAKDSARWRGELRALRGFPSVLSHPAVRDEFLATMFSTAAGGTPPAGLRDALLAEAPATRELLARRTELWDTHLALRRSLPTAMIMQELPQPRPAHVLTRGNYDAPGEPVTAGAPEELLAPWPEGAPRNRLGLAQWFTQPSHPLTARVVVNRFWAQLFGTGLVKTLDDFGTQGEYPSHPELLDWLARDFVESGWNVKALFKTLVLSATYRQSSAVSADLVARDPENRLLARGPRVRLPAELIRDQALAVSGLLAPQIGGPSVYPYQPEKLYAGVTFDAGLPGSKWLPGTGSDLYRRSLYTFWKRTLPHPAMRAFDLPDREVCTVRRSRTNTPLQALTLLNEPGYLEAARVLAARMIREGGPDDAARVAYGFRLATGRRPAATEAKVLTTTWAELRRDFAAHGDDAYAFVRVGASPLDGMLPPAELAAATAVASMILNLDETITNN